MSAPPNAAWLPALVDFRQRHDVPAVGGGVVVRGGGFDWEVTGVRLAGSSDPARRDDRWHLGSCGKSITAALYARLVEAGMAAWGTRLPDLFPDLTAGIHRAWTDTSIDALFVHRAGLPANLDRRALRAGWRDGRPVTDQRTEVVAAALARPPRRPGPFAYSNLGYIVIGAAIERITKLPFEEALGRHVLEPLGISSGGFGPPAGVWGHGGWMLMLGPLGAIDIGRGRPADPARPESDNPAVMSPAGRLHLSLEDWARFQRVFIGESGTFLRPETVERLLTPATGAGPSQALGWAPAGRMFAGASFAQQGSNTYWVATAIIDRPRQRTAIVVCNRGSAKLLARTPHLAMRLLEEA